MCTIQLKSSNHNGNSVYVMQKNKKKDFISVRGKKINMESERYKRSKDMGGRKGKNLSPVIKTVHDWSSGMQVRFRAISSFRLPRLPSLRSLQYHKLAPTSKNHLVCHFEGV